MEIFQRVIKTAIRMALITKHWTETLIEKPTKSKNAPLIEMFTGVKNYKARADQIKEVMKFITAENYKDMYDRVRKLETRDTVEGSSNFGRFAKLFASDDASWIDEINHKLES